MNGSHPAPRAAWPPRPVPLDHLKAAECTLVDGIVAHFLLETAYVLVCQHAAVAACHVAECAQPLAPDVPYALAEELARNDDLYTLLLRTLYPPLQWDEGDYGVTQLDGQYYFMAPNGGVARWAPTARRLLAGVYDLVPPVTPPIRPHWNFALVPVQPSAPPLAPVPGHPTPAVLAALQAQHRPSSHPGTAVYLQLRAGAVSIGELQGVHGLHAALPLPPALQETSGRPRLLAVVLLLALQAQILVRFPLPSPEPGSDPDRRSAVAYYRSVGGPEAVAERR